MMRNEANFVRVACNRERKTGVANIQQSVAYDDDV